MQIKKQYIRLLSSIYQRYVIHMLGIYYTYTSSRFNFCFIKPVTLKLYNYNSLKKTIIRRVEKHFIKYLNIAALNTTSTLIRMSSVYALYIIGLSLN